MTGIGKELRNRRNAAKRALRSATAAAAVAFAFLACPTKADAAEKVFVFAYGGSLDSTMKKNFHEPFERQTGIKVVAIPNDFPKLYASIKAGTPDVDINNLPGAYLHIWSRENALEPIDYSQIRAEDLQAIPENQKHKYGIGAWNYSNGMAYSTTDFPVGKPRPQTWSDFWNVSKYPGPRGLAGCSRLLAGGTLEFAALAAGASVDKLYPIDIDVALAKIKELKPHVSKFWDQYSEVTQALINGEMSMSPTSNGRIYIAKQQGAPVDWNWNQSLLQQEYWVIPKKSPNLANAMKLLAFMAQAEAQAGFARDTGFGPVNQVAYKQLPAEIVQSLPGSPDNLPKQIQQNYGWWSEVGASGKPNLDVVLEKCVAALAH